MEKEMEHEMEQEMESGRVHRDVHSEHEEFASAILYTEEPPTIRSFYGSGLLQSSYYSKPLPLGPKQISLEAFRS